MTGGHYEWFVRKAVDSKTSKQIQSDVYQEVNASRHFSSKHAKSFQPPLAHFDREELKIGKLVGKGTFSEVYELESIDVNTRFHSFFRSKAYKLNRRKTSLRSNKLLSNGSHPFVVKHLRPSLVEKQSDFRHAATELLLEAYYLASFSHPNIISVQAVAAKGAKAYSEGFYDAFFIVMDRVEITLSDKMEQWKTLSVSLSDRIEIIESLASAAAYLHHLYIIYRDFKPANVGFDMNGNVKLLDFGLIAEIPKGENKVTNPCGTPRYMAPECYFGKPYDYKADVYSITVILWEVLAFQRHFNDLNAMDHVHYVLQEGAREMVSNNWPEGIRSILNQGWSADPTNRPSMQDTYTRLSREKEKLRQKEFIDDDNMVRVNVEQQGLHSESSSGDTQCSEGTEETARFGIRVEI